MHCFSPSHVITVIAPFSSACRLYKARGETRKSPSCGVSGSFPLWPCSSGCSKNWVLSDHNEARAHPSTAQLHRVKLSCSFLSTSNVLLLLCSSHPQVLILPLLNLGFSPQRSNPDFGFAWKDVNVLVSARLISSKQLSNATSFVEPLWLSLLSAVSSAESEKRCR